VFLYDVGWTAICQLRLLRERPAASPLHRMIDNIANVAGRCWQMMQCVDLE